MTRPRSFAPPLADILARRLSRRATLKGALTAAGGLGFSLFGPPAFQMARAGTSSLGFDEVDHGNDPNHHVPEGYEARVLIRWGEPVTAGAPAWAHDDQSPADQAGQFGFNNDYIAYFPLPRGSADSGHGLLVVNHESVNPGLMFENYEKGRPSARQVGIEMAAHGMSVIEIAREAAGWWVVFPSPFARRLTANGSAFDLTGPAAGSARLRSTDDPTGSRVTGTLNNCAGGVTPWGTVLSAEENFHFYFQGDPSATTEAENHARYHVAEKPYLNWAALESRFDVEREPNEPNRFGWLVELDPYDPSSTPAKRTALGRFSHEGASVVINSDGRVVIYSGDDRIFEYVYRFVSDGIFDPSAPATNRDLLNAGTLSVARFGDDGTLRWLPLAWGRGPLTPANGFIEPADVLIETRRAADLLGATPMDRPEDIEASPVTGRLYLALTNNRKRQFGATDRANPRAPNPTGHILELSPPVGPGGEPDHAAEQFGWEILLLADNPEEHAGSDYHPAVSTAGWLVNPDNLAFDAGGRLWIASDGAPKTAGLADGLWACEVDGAHRALPRHFFRAPSGAEVCGPCFTPDNRTLFLAVQHPAAAKMFVPPLHGWPDFEAGGPPRPAGLAITHRDGGPIGS